MNLKYLLLFILFIFNFNLIFSQGLVYSYVNDTPMITSWALDKAYPEVEYNIRMGVVGGKFPYSFSLLEFPIGMDIDSRGEITWVPDISLENSNHSVKVNVTDSLNQSVYQEFNITVTKQGFYFVSPSGSDSNGGSINSPFKTINHGMQQGTNDDILYVRDGTYYGKPLFESGTINKLIAYPGDSMPKIDNNLTGAMNPRNDYTYFDGFEVYNIRNKGFFVENRHNLIVRRNYMHHLYDQTSGENPSFVFTAGIASTDPINKKNGIIIQDNIFHDLFDRGSGVNGDLTSNNHGGSVVLYDTKYLLYEDNIAYNIDGNCIKDKDGGWRNTIRGNVVKGNCSHIGLVMGGQAMGRNRDVLYNVIYNPKKSFNTGTHADGIFNLTVHHNTFIGPVNFDKNLYNLSFYDNIVYSPQTSYIINPCNSTDPKYFRYFIDNNLIYSYNINYIAKTRGNYCPNAAGTQNNVYGYYNISYWREAGNDINSYFESPLFKDYKNFNFKPYSDSFVCGTGIDSDDIGALSCLDDSSGIYTSINPVSQTNLDSDYTNPVLYYDFEGTDDFIVTDKSIYQNLGYFEGNARRSSGFIGNGIFLDGESSIIIPHKKSLNIEKKYTIVGWFYHSEPSLNSAGLFGKGPFGVSQYKSWGQNVTSQENTTKMIFRRNYLNAYQPYTNYLFPTYRWTYFVLVSDGINLKIYFDNNLDKTISWNNLDISSDEDFTIGYAMGYQASQGNFIGYIDEFRIYDFALNEGNISTLYNLTLSGKDLTSPSQVLNLSYYNLTNISVKLSWDSSTDNFEVLGYKLFRNDIEIIDIFNTTYLDMNLIPNTSYNYKVQAYDTSNNLGLFSDELNIYTGILQTCNNDILDSGEDCDTSQLNSKTCQSFEFETGTLSCTLTCTFNTTSCKNTFEKETSSSNKKTSSSGSTSSSFFVESIEEINLTNVCIPSYKYFEWSTCQDGKQTQFIEDINGCESDEYQERICHLGLTDEENLFLNAKKINLNNFDKKKYKAQLDSGYNEIFYLDEKLEDDIFIFQDETSGQEYYSQYYDSVDDKHYYTLKRVDEGIVTILQEEGILDSSFSQDIDNLKKTGLFYRIFIGFVIILFMGILFFLFLYIRKIKGDNSFN